MHVYHPACVYSDFLVSCPAPPIPQHYIMIQHIECCMCNWEGLSITLVLCLLWINHSSVSKRISCVLILVNSISLQPSDHDGSSTQGGPLLIIHPFKASLSSSGQVWAFQVPLPSPYRMCKQNSYTLICHIPTSLLWHITDNCHHNRQLHVWFMLYTHQIHT